MKLSEAQPRPQDKRVKRWAHLCSTNASFQIESIEIIESKLFAPQRVDLARACAIVGAHGTGKSLLMNTIEAAFGYAQYRQMPPFMHDDYGIGAQPSAVDGIVRVTVRKGEERLCSIVDLSAKDEDRRALWYDLLGDAFGVWYTSAPHALDELILYFQEYPFDRHSDFTGEELEFSRDDLDGIRNILGRSYDRVVVKTVITDPGPKGYPASLAPHVLAYSGEKLVDNTMMSLGELWVHLLLGWTARRSGAEPLLIDEPESFLAARGHRPLLDEVARHVVRNGSQLLVSTHSTDVLSRFPLENIRICVPSSNGIHVITPRSLIQIRDAVGVRTPVSALLLVEDDFARRIISGLCDKLGGGLLREMEIVVCGGHSEVVSGLRALHSVRRISCFAVLDGDARHIGTKVEGLRERLLFLPGRRSPEDELRFAAESEIDWIAEKLSTRTADILAALSFSVGSDHQYWPRQFAQFVGCSEDELIPVLIGAWLRNPDVSNQALHLMASIRAQIDALDN